MTLLTWIGFVPRKLEERQGPPRLCCKDVSVVIPVKDNQAGLERFLDVLLETHDANTLPGEVVVVDNASATPVTIPDRFTPQRVPVHVVCCSRPGPASARNAGCKASAGNWLLFTDSDCVPTASFLSGYAVAMNGSIAYAGHVQSDGSDRLSRYYESQEILVPPKVAGDRPQYLITANALVWREAFEALGGFDEEFLQAGGEDVDLGFRLSQIGALSYAPSSIVRHDFKDGYEGFLRRFVRYGRGNRRLAVRYQIDLRPRVFRPTERNAYNRIAALIQFLCLSWGYWVPWPRRWLLSQPHSDQAAR